VIGIDGAQGVAVAGEVELDGSQGVMGAQDVDLALAEALKSFQSVVALWTVSCEIGVERGDALQVSFAIKSRSSSEAFS